MNNVSSSMIFMFLYLKSVDSEALIGSLNKSPTNLSVCHQYIITSLLLIFCFTKIYLIFRCLVFLLDLRMPFCLSTKVLQTSCKIEIVSAALYSCSSKKCPILRTCTIKSSTAINSVSVQLFEFLFCLYDNVCSEPLLTLNDPPVCLLQLS